MIIQITNNNNLLTEKQKTKIKRINQRNQKCLELENQIGTTVDLIKQLI